MTVRPPVEPLSDLSWARVERSVFAELDASTVPTTVPAARPRHRWMLMAAPLAAAAAVILWFVMRPDGHGIDGPRVVTGDTPTTLSFGDAEITASAHSALELNGSADSGVLIVVERGGATFAVAKRHGRPPFDVRAGDIRVRVVGTRFLVSRSGDAAAVKVYEGTVEVVGRGQRVMVHAGESWSSQEARREAATDAATAAEAGSVPDAASESGSASASESGSAPDAATAPARRERRHPAVVKERPAPQVAAEPEDDIDRVSSELTTKEQFELAAQLELQDPAAAFARYRTLAHGSGPWAANALYAAGRLAFDGGNADLARRLLKSYLRRFPAGGNARDARGLLDRL